MMSRSACSFLILVGCLIVADVSPARPSRAATLPAQERATGADKANENGATGNRSDERGAGGSGNTRHVLALTWQPGFCLSKPALPECAGVAANAEPESAPQHGLSLHGLWQVRKRYCGIDADLERADRSGRWADLPQLVLSEKTARRLAVAMPGVASGLDRHQWLMNGTCHAATAEDYFDRSLAMLAAVNGTAVGSFFDAHAGTAVAMADVAAVFDEAFGEGAGDRVRLRCRTVDGETIVTGVTIGLSAADGDLATLILAASATTSTCDAGFVAPAAGD